MRSRYISTEDDQNLIPLRATASLFLIAACHKPKYE